MKAKTSFISQSDINIELLIQEGIQNHKKQQAEADAQAKYIEEESKQFAD